ncbi:MAG: hypothetical protein M3Z26_06380 [Bacteroidota bacterium]|nr:hypothetical protein [Bacteroidota bacterium]
MNENNLKEVKEENQKSYDIITKVEDEDTMKKELFNHIRASLSDSLTEIQKKETAKQTVNKLATPWWIYFLKIDPATYLKKVKCPVLALNGSKDLQFSHDQNISAIKQALTEGGNKKVTTEILLGLNHLFQECTIGLPNEYANIEQTFSPTALSIIKDWILKQTK